MSKPAILLLLCLPFAYSQNTATDMSPAPFGATLAMEQTQNASTAEQSGAVQGARTVLMYAAIATTIVAIGAGVTLVYLWIKRQRCPLCTENAPKLDSCAVVAVQTADTLCSKDSLLMAGAIGKYR
jgi:hypothetical protein